MRRLAAFGAKGRTLVLGAALSALLVGAQQAAAQNIIEDLFGGGSSPPAATPQPRAPPPARVRKQEKPKPKKTEPPKRAQPRPASAPAASTHPAPAVAAPIGAAATEPPPPPYEPQMLRLAEILGAVSFLRDLCRSGDGDEWRAKMTTLLDAEAPAAGARRQKMTASFNRGFRGYELTYRACTPNAETAVSRYLDEASQIARDVGSRYGNP